jgi:hypothetical protein
MQHLLDSITGGPAYDTVDDQGAYTGLGKAIGQGPTQAEIGAAWGSRTAAGLGADVEAFKEPVDYGFGEPEAPVAPVEPVAPEAPAPVAPAPEVPLEKPTDMVTEGDLTEAKTERDAAKNKFLRLNQTAGRLSRQWADSFDKLTPEQSDKLFREMEEAKNSPELLAADKEYKRTEKNLTEVSKAKSESDAAWGAYRKDVDKRTMTSKAKEVEALAKEGKALVSKYIAKEDYTIADGRVHIHIDSGLPKAFFKELGITPNPLNPRVAPSQAESMLIRAYTSATGEYPDHKRIYGNDRSTPPLLKLSAMQGTKEKLKRLRALSKGKLPDGLNASEIKKFIATRREAGKEVDRMDAKAANAESKLKIIRVLGSFVGGKKRSVSVEEARKLGIIK